MGPTSESLQTLMPGLKSDTRRSIAELKTLPELDYRNLSPAEQESVIQHLDDFSPAQLTQLQLPLDEVQRVGKALQDQLDQNAIWTSQQKNRSVKKGVVGFVAFCAFASVIPLSWATAALATAVCLGFGYTFYADHNSAENERRAKELKEFEIRVEEPQLQISRKLLEKKEAARAELDRSVKELREQLGSLENRKNQLVRALGLELPALQDGEEQLRAVLDRIEFLKAEQRDKGHLTEERDELIEQLEAAKRQKEKLTMDQAVLEEQVRDLQQTARRMTRRINAGDRLLAKNHETTRQLAVEIQQARINADLATRAVESRLELLNKEKADLDREFQALKVELKTQEEQLQRKLKLKATSEELWKQLAFQHENQSNRLKTDMAVMLEELETLRMVEVEFKQRKKELLGVQSELDTAAHNQTVLAAELTQLKVEHETAVHKKNEFERQISGQKKSLKKQKRVLEQKEEKLRQKEQTLAQLQTEHEALNKDFMRSREALLRTETRLTSEQESHAKTQQRLIGQNSDYDNVRQNWEKEIVVRNSLKQEVSELRLSVQKRETALNTLRHELEGKNQEIVTLKQANQHLEAVRKKQAITEDELRAEIDKVKKQLLAPQAEIQALRKTLSEMGNQLKAFQQEFRHEQERIKALVRSQAIDEKAVIATQEKLMKEADDAMERFLEVKKQKEELVEMHKKLQSSWEDAEQELTRQLQATKKELADTQKQLEVIRDRRTFDDDTLQQITQELNKALADKIEAEEQLKQEQQKIAELTLELEAMKSGPTGGAEAPASAEIGLRASLQAIRLLHLQAESALAAHKLELLQAKQQLAELELTESDPKRDGVENHMKEAKKQLDLHVEKMMEVELKRLELEKLMA